MNISFEAKEKVNGLMTIVVEESDFQADVEKTLKDMRRRANVPGFRPGMAPMSMIKRQYGASVKMDAINKVVGQELYKYIQENKIQMLGEPLPSAQQEPVDIEGAAPYTFKFDIAVAPEFNAELTANDTIDYYNINIDDELINRQVEMYASRAGRYEKVETFEGNDMLKGDLRELDAEGNTLEGGITVEAAIMMPEYIKVDDQKKLFEGAKLGDIITFNPKKAYPENLGELTSLLKISREQAETLTSDFSYQITEISRFTKAEVGQELFDQTYGKDAVKSEEEFRQRISDELKPQLVNNSDFKFLLDVRKYLENKVGQLTYPDEILKRIMKQNNKDKADDYVEKNYEGSIRELTWHLMKEQLVAANEIKIDDAEIMQAAKGMAATQFAQYGMNNVPEEYLENYAKEMLKKDDSRQGIVDRAIDVKLTAALKSVVKLNEKSVSLDEFNKLMAE
ncbi:MAG: trigger factor [Prevotella sp.]|nr:trigger factor [Prevotella sp.]